MPEIGWLFLEPIRPHNSYPDFKCSPAHSSYIKRRALNLNYVRIKGRMQLINNGFYEFLYRDKLTFGVHKHYSIVGVLILALDYLMFIAIVHLNPFVLSFEHFLAIHLHKCLVVFLLLLCFDQILMFLVDIEISFVINNDLASAYWANHFRLSNFSNTKIAKSMTAVNCNGFDHQLVANRAIHF